MLPHHFLLAWGSVEPIAAKLSKASGIPLHVFLFAI